MIKAVIDTNVIVSALIKPESKPGKIMKMVFEGKIFPVVNNAMLEEYGWVLKRRKFAFTREEVAAFLHVMGRVVFESGENGTEYAGVPESDRAFVQAAEAGGADCLITGNVRHFPAKKYGRCRVVTPGMFLQECGK